MDGDHDPADPGMTEESLDRMGADRVASDRAILFRPVGLAGPLSAAGGDDDDGGFVGLCV